MAVTYQLAYFVPGEPEENALFSVKKFSDECLPSLGATILVAVYSDKLNEFVELQVSSHIFDHRRQKSTGEPIVRVTAAHEAGQANIWEKLKCSGWYLKIPMEVTRADT